MTELKSIIKAVKNWRNYILVPLAIIGFFGVFSEPASADDLIWTLQLIISKAIGFGACWAAYKLGEYWSKRGELHFEELFGEEED